MKRIESSRAVAMEVGALMDFTDRQCLALARLFRLVADDAFKAGILLGRTHPEASLGQLSAIYDGMEGDRE